MLRFSIEQKGINPPDPLLQGGIECVFGIGFASVSALRGMGCVQCKAEMSPYVVMQQEMRDWGLYYPSGMLMWYFLQLQ